MTKRAFLIHGWDGYPEEGWRPWLQEKLEQDGFKVTVPSMPDSGEPKFEAWLAHLEKLVGTPDKDCYFVGHSLGCITILRYLEKIQTKIGGMILVAGFTSNLGFVELEGFFTTPIKWKTIKENCKHATAIHSDNDPFVSLHYADFFKEHLNADIIIEHGKKHFSGDDGINTLPSALEAIKKMVE